MVMRKNMMRKNLSRSVAKSLGRYIAIVMIIALGAGLFVGLRNTKTDMVATGQVFADQQNMFDLRLMSTVGWTREQVGQIAGLEGIIAAEGMHTLDALVSVDDSRQEAVYKVHSIPDTVSKVYLLSGRMPQSSQECLADGFFNTDDIIGKKIHVSNNNLPDTVDALKHTTYTVVGRVSTPLYMDMSRGNTTLGDGTVAAYLYLPEESFTQDFYTEVHIALDGESQIYTDAYNDAMIAAADRLEPYLLPLAEDRLETLLTDAEKAYRDGLAEYEKGRAEFETAEADALKELDEAKQKLEDGEKELADNRKLLEDSLKLLEDGQKEIDRNRLTILQSRVTLNESKAQAFTELSKANAELLRNYKTVNENLKQVRDGISQIDAGLIQIDSGITQLESGLQQLDMMVTVVDTMLSVVRTSIDLAQSALDRAEQSGADAETIARLRQELQTYIDQQEEYFRQQEELHAQQEEYTGQLEELKVQREELAQQKAQLEATLKTLEEAKEAIDVGFIELQNNQTQAENQFISAEAQIDAAQLKLETAQAELDMNKRSVEDGLKKLEEGEKELAEGWEEYNTGYRAAMEELDDARTQLDEAARELADARETIDSMPEAAVYLLPRTTNVGYVSLDSSSDIVEGVSAVFPVFFLLIAALVGITTMTRMVEEERTQIGTLKALGYSNAAIIGKYMAYAGSAAVLGCGVGVFVGSVFFPLTLWDAYSIMLTLLPHLVLKIDWPLCLTVVFAYTAVTLFVTWFACRVSLREVPAELIRPKAPTSGKKIFLEYLPFWNKFSFLNKVMLRNIFRYRQRLLMMLVGIGGCTALLLTGFGFRDSIIDVVSYQFEEITMYDLEVRFVDAVTPEDQADFRNELDGLIDEVGFFHQSSVELEFDNAVKDLVLIASDTDLERFMDFHRKGEALSMPKSGEVLLSIGVTENLGIHVGDTVILRDADMQPMEVVVSGIYENYVNNYAIVTPETVRQGWDKEPQPQMACITLREDQDAHEAGAVAGELTNVLSVTVNEDVADQIGTMLEALDAVVLVIVICAGLLAVIVLYNLTNINITERIREIATIKVLGFNASESAAYVFKENLLLSAMGSILGLGGGVLLLEFVMSKIRIDFVWFQSRLHLWSFVLAIVLTMLAACLVDFVLYFKLEKINMAEALKSVE